jgi:DMSO/TMAO reductase YedYZ molybdopterin-dependent catalytic subunit
MKNEEKIIPMLILLFLITGCITAENKSLKEVEIRGYKGERLDSVSNLRENSIKGPQNIDIKKYHLEITGLVKNPTNLSYNEILDLPKFKKVVQLDCVEGWSAKLLWEGIKVSDLIKKTQPLPVSNTVIFYAYDNYSSSFPIAYLINNSIIIAYKMNNLTLPPERGYPFQLIAESKWGYKWIKWITKIELSDNKNYRGYWEEKGYSNSGNLNESYYI